MEQIAGLMRELCSHVVTLFRSLLAFLLVALVLTCYLLYRIVIWVGEHPAVLILPLVALVSVWLLKRYVLGRKVAVERNSALIVLKAGGRLEPFYRGWHKLKFGERVCEKLSLNPESVETNLEEVYTFNEERVRLSAVYEIHISDPIHFYRRKRDNPVDLMELNLWALQDVIQDFSSDDLYNVPFQINARIEQSINGQLRDFGLHVNYYRLDEAIWPETNEQWRRNRSPLSLQAGQYWNDARSLRQRLH
jgi:hypothetical protein